MIQTQIAPAILLPFVIDAVNEAGAMIRAECFLGSSELLHPGMTLADFVWQATHQ